MIQREYEVVVAILCDFCMQEEFIPDLEPADEREISLAWEQAEICGWEKRLDQHCCPICMKKKTDLLTIVLRKAIEEIDSLDRQTESLTELRRILSRALIKDFN